MRWAVRAASASTSLVGETVEAMRAQAAAERGHVGGGGGRRRRRPRRGNPEQTAARALQPADPERDPPHAGRWQRDGARRARRRRRSRSRSPTSARASPQAERERVFEPFYRGGGGARARRRRRSGLGRCRGRSSRPTAGISGSLTRRAGTRVRFNLPAALCARRTRRRSHREPDSPPTRPSAKLRRPLLRPLPRGVRGRRRLQALAGEDRHRGRRPPLLPDHDEPPSAAHQRRVRGQEPAGPQRRGRPARLLAGARHERLRRLRQGDRQPRHRGAHPPGPGLPRRHAVRPRPRCSRRESWTKPDRGTVKVHTRVYNQDGVLVAEFKRLVLVPAEDPGAWRTPSTGPGGRGPPDQCIHLAPQSGETVTKARRAARIRPYGPAHPEAGASQPPHGIRRHRGADSTVRSKPLSRRRNASSRGWRRSPQLTQPDDVHWCDGSAEEYDRLCQELVDAGTFKRLSDAKRPNSYLGLVRSRPTSRASRTARSSAPSDEEDAGPTNNWRDPAEMRDDDGRAVPRRDAGRTMYVVPVLDGPARLGQVARSASSSPTRPTSWCRCGS